MPIALACIAGLMAVSALALALVRHRAATPIVYGACLAIALTLCALAVLSVGRAPSALILPLGLPWLGAHFRLDPLAAAFLVIVNFGAAGASLYALGYGRHEAQPARVLPFYPAFLAAMNLVLLADDAYSFLLSWELMSLASWALVMTRHRAAKTAYAGFVYLLMASFGTFALLFVFGLLAGAHGDYAFDAMRAHPLAPGMAGLALVLALIGAGSKAGLAPLHVWLPLAHPAAPSHVSALMSGVMTKVAVYAFIRIVFDLLGNPSWWWSLPALLLGGATAVIGVLYALMQTDLKRVLAYSTIENVGIIFIAIGLALAFKANGLAGAAALALTAALFHALNHMLFKSTLFFGAGTVIVATGAQDMERLGGLIRRMPLSSAAFLAASMAISALPPFNGFASEWLLFQSILVSPQLPQMGLKLLVPAVGVLLALAAAFAAACFVRAFGATYLGRARTAAAAQAREADRWSVAAMLICAALCLLAGLLPGSVIDWLQAPVSALVAGRMPPQAGIAWLSIVPVSASRSSYNGLLLFGFVAACAGLAAVVVHRLAARTTRKVPFWDCGYPGLGIAAQYSATTLAQPIRRVFASVAFAAHEQVEMPLPGDPRPAVLRRFLRDPVWDFIYTPIGNVVGASATTLNHVQFLTIRRYLSFVFIALVVLLMVLALWG
jgi:formate hydrogenlyase subunit 3/multisubunit Na+/H+ antiporter MnhD subunit